MEAKNRECACKAFVCNSGNCGKGFVSGELWKTFGCVYDNSWKWVESHPNNQVPSDFCCSDADCSGYDPSTHLKLVCDCPDTSKCSLHKDNNYRCKPLLKCDVKEQCADGWCCDKEIGGSGNCVQGIYSGNPKYLCDPPGWEAEEASEKKSLLELILSFNPFS